MLITLLLSIALSLMPIPAQQEVEWQVGNIVGLRIGTCIREGPGFSYRAHTHVPEDGWAVMVIDGPRFADGRTWYDTSRRAAGDPSGGTGWVDASQTDVCPSGIASTDSGHLGSNTSPAVADPNSGSIADVFRQVFNVLFWGGDLRLWWEGQSEGVRWAAAIVALAFLVWLWRKFGSYLFLFLEFYFLGAFLYWICDLTRETWEPAWWRFAGTEAPDLAALIALLPVIYWAVVRITRFSRHARY